MRTLTPLQSPACRSRIAPKSLHARRPNRLMALAAILFAGKLLFCVEALASQTPAMSPAASISSTPAHKPVHPHTRPGAAHPQTPPPQTLPAPVVTPPALEPPPWPVNETPSEASVIWDSRGLHIDAANSSLQQILKDVSTATGAKVEGMGSDERVFGFYGPGLARDVLSQLLQGTGYNVLLIGDEGQGAPREIVLSTRQAASAQPNARPNPVTTDEDADVDEPQQQQEPGRPRFQPGYPAGGPPRTPQQIEMMQRQLEMQRQQQAQPPNPQPNQPNQQPGIPPN